ncbi:iron ABC transporter permease [Alteromonas sediminis]|uniref:Iron ABC transporter permease n=1 Tax=Alteromonas sediminis TaxID=2259342 RepID=A0A3N5Y5S8_9ALTE|nr:iron ABC transporter permease [Alteromonas sediminis]RPJ68546.1 iron ABC transporter permease [Alteromonas sediminis]
MSRILFWLLLGLILLPLGVVLSSIANPDFSLLQHLYQTVLLDYVSNSVLLAVGVGVGVAIIGASLAWALTQYSFYGSRLLGWLAVLPLAMPAYIIAYTYTGLLDYSGPVQQFLRATFDWQYGDYWFPNVRSLGGAIVMMTLVLFPYVYLLARNAFTAQSHSLREASASMGVTRWHYFSRIAWPLAWPAIVAGMALAMMEALADYGTVAYFGVSTFTSGVFRTWFGMGSRQTALQLAAMLTLIVFVVIWLEQRSRHKVRHATKGNAREPVRLTGLKGMGMALACSLPVFLGFILPVIQLSSWAVSYLPDWSWQDYAPLVSQSVMLAGITALATVLLALFLSYTKRWYTASIPQWAINLASMGYALPGIVIAVGVLVPLGFFDIKLNAFTNAWFGYQPGLILSGTMVVLVFAYMVRFVAVALQHTQTGLQTITPNMDDAARSLGVGSVKATWRVHLPIMKPSLIAALLLVFVDVLKELPATLVLRPFNVNTLAVKAYELAMDERLQQAALPALSIVLCGILPVLLLIRQLRKHEDKYAKRA